MRAVVESPAVERKSLLIPQASVSAPRSDCLKRRHCCRSQSKRVRKRYLSITGGGLSLAKLQRGQFGTGFFSAQSGPQQTDALTEKYVLYREIRALKGERQSAVGETERQAAASRSVGWQRKLMRNVMMASWYAATGF